MSKRCTFRSKCTVYHYFDKSYSQNFYPCALKLITWTSSEVVPDKYRTCSSSCFVSSKSIWFFSTPIITISGKNSKNLRSINHLCVVFECKNLRDPFKVVNPLTVFQRAIFGKITRSRRILDEITPKFDSEFSGSQETK